MFRVKSFIAGVIFTITVILIGGSVMAAIRHSNIGVYFQDIKILYHGKEVAIRDENNALAEPFMYNGRAYIPIRGVAEAFGKTVDWDTSSKRAMIFDNDPENDFVYTNSDYAFNVRLPESWTGYTIVEETWQGTSIDESGQPVASESGVTLLIRHPLWVDHEKRQDIPIMVFTQAQWQDLYSEQFHIGAAPINPSMLAQNVNYVFALPARYNFANLTGFEEVQRLLDQGAVSALSP